VLHIVEGCVIELKLPLEGTVGQASPALEHGYCLVENLLKCHRQPSRCRGGVQKTVWEWDRPFGRMGLDHRVGHPRLSLGHAAALQQRRQGACEDSDVSRRARTWRRQEARPMICSLTFSHESADTRVYSPGQLHIGEAAYFVWAYPPNGGGTEGTYRFIATRPPPSQRWGCPSTSGKRRAWALPSCGGPHSGRRGDRNQLLWSTKAHYVYTDIP